MPDKMTFYTIVSAFWMAFLAVIGINIFAGMVMPEERVVETAGYPIVVPDAPAAGAAAEGPVARTPVQPLIAVATVEDGAAQFKKCASCHTIDAGGRNLTGPNLHNIVGDAVAGRDGFKVSESLAAVGGTWTYDKLDDYLENPKRLAPRGTMSFAGLRRVEERAAVIKFLMANTENPPALEVAAPAAEAAPAEAVPAEAAPAAPQ